jgi:hypothetical protein
MGFVRGRGAKRKMRDGWNDRFEELKILPVPEGIPIVVAECHANIVEVFSQFVSPIVVDYDSHYDRYNSDYIVDCANWVVHLERYGGEYFNAGEWNWHRERIDAVFLCRSSPWTPAEMDGYFYELLWHLCFHAQVKPKFIGHMKKSMRRSYVKKFDDERAVAQ